MMFSLRRGRFAALRRRLATGTALVVGAALLAGCGEGLLNNNSSTGAKPTIASLVQPLDNPWVVDNVRFQKEVAKALGINLIVATDNGTEDSNIAAMQSLIARKPDAILFDPITQTAGREDARLLEQAGIPGATEDRLVVPDIRQYRGSQLIAQVTQNNRQWGYDMMMSLVNQGSRKAVAIMDPHGVTTVEEAWSGARQAAAQHGVRVLQQSWQPKSRENAISTMNAYLARYPRGQVDGCWCIGSTVGLGALYAAQQAGREKEIKISTADDDKFIIRAIQRGQLTSTLGGHWMNGGFGLIVLYDYLKGKQPLQRQPQFNLITIDRAHAARYARQFLDGPPFTDDQIRALSQAYDPKADLPQVMQTLHQTWQQTR
jgi:ABC-type sugar transport system substrate-binding protein